MASKEFSHIHGHIKIQIYDDGSTQFQQQKIQKVPKLLRGIQSINGPDQYAPMVVSIGPYHHGKEELMEMEKLKLEFASKYFPSSLEEMYASTINANGARIFYSDDDGSFPTELNDDEIFSKMMFLDGCFILHFISSFLSQKGTGMKPYLESYVIRDLFLLENQLPYLVLEVLMNLSKGYTKKEEECTLEKIIKFIGVVRHSATDEKKNSKTVCKKIASKCNDMSNKVIGLCFRSETNTPDLENVISKPPVHLLELFHTQFREQNPAIDPPTSQNQNGFRYRSAKELKNSGIHFKQSESSNFDDIKYNSYFFYTYLSLPSVLVDELSKSLLLNLAAYESCPDTPADAFQVSSYIVFLNLLIDNAEDVKELRSKGILFNSLGSDQDVVTSLNEMSTYLMIHRNAFWKVRYKIDQRYQSKTKKWITEWLNDHFSSPWTVLAFVGASIGLGLTAVETYNSFKVK